MHTDIADPGLGFDAQLFKQMCKPDVWRWLVHDQPHRPLFRMRTDVDDAMRKTLITHLWHRDQQLAAKVHMGLFVHIAIMTACSVTRKHDLNSARHNVSSISNVIAYLDPMKPLVPILAIAACAVPLGAAADPFAHVAKVEVLPGWQTQDGTHMAGLQVTLAPGWKTYWRAPGDAGIPPQFSWAGSDNIAGAAFHWPTPEVIDQNAMRAIGYHGGMVLPIELIPNTAGAPITLSGEISMGICEDICIPVTLPFEAVLPPDGGRDTAIAAALLNQPLTAAEADVAAATCIMRPGTDSMQVTATVTMPPAGENETVVIETANPKIWVSPADVMRDGDRLYATVDMMHVTGSDFAIDRSGVRITVLGSNYAVDVQGCSAQ